MRSKWVWFSLLLVAGAAACASAALATPGQGQTNTILSLGALQADLAFNTGITPQANGVSWEGRQYSVNQLPEFLMRLRSEGVTSVGEWLNLHPAVSAKFGMIPVGLLHSPEIVTQQTKFAPGAFSGWHSHPGYLTATVVSGQVVRYGTDCSSQTFTAGQTFYETAAKTFIVKNESTADAVVIVTFVVPGGTPTTALRVDKPQPSTCSK
jgi:quercetin dioxygenase-like cupin family protein